ncbi:MAG: hypothetical protein JRM87_05205 [Nitrososphaerota archaeon]|nr:hypothetical protein [Nitrososphaerota archaeon]
MRNIIRGATRNRACFAQDKKLLGWTVAQRRDDRIGCALFSMELWHNLFNLAS